MNLSRPQAAHTPSEVYPSRRHLWGVILLLGGLCFSITSSGLVTPLLGLRLKAMGASTQMVGLLQSVVFAGLFTGGLLSNKLINLFGLRKAILVSWSVVASSVFCFYFFDQLGVWFVARFFMGVGLLGVYASAESWLNLSVRDLWRARLLGLYMVVNYLSISSGQFVLGIVDKTDDQGFLWAVLLYLLAMLPALVAQTPAHKVNQNRPDVARRLSTWGALKHVARQSPLALAGVVANGLVVSANYGLAVICGEGLGLTGFELSRFLSLPMFMALALQMPLSYFSDRLDRRALLLYSMVSAGALCALPTTGLLPDRVALFLALTGVGIVMVTYGLSTAYANDRLPRDYAVAISVAMLTSHSIAGVIGPLVAPWVMRWLGGMGLFTYFALVYALAMSFLFLEKRSKI